jgi:hypothetical protein
MPCLAPGLLRHMWLAAGSDLQHQAHGPQRQDGPMVLGEAAPHRGGPERMPMAFPKMSRSIRARSSSFCNRRICACGAETVDAAVTRHSETVARTAAAPSRPPVAPHRRPDRQLLCCLHLRTAAALQQPHRLTPELLSEPAPRPGCHVSWSSSGHLAPSRAHPRCPPTRERISVSIISFEVSVRRTRMTELRAWSRRRCWAYGTSAHHAAVP